MNKPIKPNAVLKVAANLLSEDAENPEYDRAIVEMTIDLIGGNSDEKEIVERLLRTLKD